MVSNLNKHLLGLDEDYLYHISLGKNMDELAKNFSDVKVLLFKLIISCKVIELKLT